MIGRPVAHHHSCYWASQMHTTIKNSSCMYFTRVPVLLNNLLYPQVTRPAAAFIRHGTAHVAPALPRATFNVKHLPAVDSKLLKFRASRCCRVRRRKRLQIDLAPEKLMVVCMARQTGRQAHSVVSATFNIQAFS
jgi:hypothetical protein